MTDARERYCPTCGGSFGADLTACPKDGASLVLLAGENTTSLEGRVIEDRFQIADKLGEGGMGAVYRARQLSVDRQVALKVVSPRLAGDRATVKRFLREARLASRIENPHSITVLDFGQTGDGLLYLVMELVRGRGLDEVLRSDGPMAPARVATIGAQICEALAAAHTLEIVHRDLKPANILLMDDPFGRDRVKVLDFGLAKSLYGDEDHTTVTETGLVCGTPAYLPPEAAMSQEVDGRADLYSLGVVLYELVSGQRPFQGASAALLLAHATDPPPRLESVPAPLWNVIERLLSKSPDDRFRSAATCREVLVAAGERLRGSGASHDAVAVVDPDDAPTVATRRSPPPSRSPETATDIGSAAIPQPRAWAARAFWLTLLAAAVAGGIWFQVRDEAPAEKPASPPAAADNQPAVAVVQATPTSAKAAAIEIPRRQLERHERAGRREAVENPALVRVVLKCSPQAEVHIGDKPAGKTPVTTELPFGESAIEVRFERRGYKTEKRQVKPDRWHTVQVRLTKKKPRTPGFIIPR